MNGHWIEANRFAVQGVKSRRVLPLQGVHSLNMYALRECRGGTLGTKKKRAIYEMPISADRS